MVSAIYAGAVVHERLRPRRHRLHYRVFSMLLDLDELPALAQRRLFGRNSSALFSFWDRDHGDGNSDDLRPWVRGLLHKAGIDPAGVSIRILCYPRILGFVFNPLTVYFCHRPDGSLLAILYEVGNTHAEKHTYVIPGEAVDGVVRQSCAKKFFVSPFVTMDCQYEFRIAVPGEKVVVSITDHDREGPLLAAVFSGTRRELTDAALLRLFVSYPLMTIKVVAGIRIEALRLWLKGVPVLPYRKADHAIGATLVVAERPNGAET